MDTQELLKRVRKIELKTRGLSNQIFSGEYHSAFKGSGMAFSEVREYVAGDEIRKIDWNVTARLNAPYVKVFDEERELTVMLLVDLSNSESFGTKNQLKKDLVTEISAVLAFSAIQNNDKIGAIFFTDTIEKFIPPKKGKAHTLLIIRELLNFEPTGKKTNINQALRYLTSVIKKRSIVFLLSDFFDDGFDNALKIANKKHDVVALKISDVSEQEIPDLGFIPLIDAETNQMVWVDTANKKNRLKYKAQMLKFNHQLQQTFQKSGVDFAEIATHQSYVKPLMNLFKKRELRR